MAISKEKGKFSLCVNKTWSVIKKKKRNVTLQNLVKVRTNKP